MCSILTHRKVFWVTWNNSFKSPLLGLFPSEVVLSSSWLFLLLSSALFLIFGVRSERAAQLLPHQELREQNRIIPQTDSHLPSQTLHPSSFLEAAAWHSWLMFRFINRSKLLLNLFSISKYPAENKIFDVCCQQCAWCLPLTFIHALVLKQIPFQLSRTLKLEQSGAWMVDFQTYQKTTFLLN